MRFGVFCQHQLPRPWHAGDERAMLLNALEQAELADRVGFDVFWEVEHHFLEEYSHSSAPEVFLAAVAARTSRIRIGHGIVQALPAINHPARIAERAATLDLLSGGRLELGTGEVSSAVELGAFGVAREHKRAMWEESLDALTRMLVETPFAGLDGAFVRMPPRNVVPKPCQRPHPPLWLACSRRETIRLAARKGLGALSFSFVEPEDAGAWVREYYEVIASDDCVPAGFAVNPSVAVVLPMMLARDEQTAIDRGIDGAHFFGYALTHYHGLPHEPGTTQLWEEFQERRDETGFARDVVTAAQAPLGVRVLQEGGLGSLRGAIGTPGQVVELIARYAAVGVDQVIFEVQAGRARHEHVCESFELFGSEVLPHFREGRERREAEKAERLAPLLEAALARRPPARTLARPYGVDEAAEVTRAQRRRSARGDGRPRLAHARVAAQDGGRRVLGRWLAGASDAEVERRFAPRVVQRGMFAAMALAFDPAAARGFEGCIVCELRAALANGDRGAQRSWTLEIKDGRARARAGAAPDPALLVRMPVADFVRSSVDSGVAVQALLAGRVEVAGEHGLLFRMAEMFGGRSPY